jgi:hypothetical protein
LSGREEIPTDGHPWAFGGVGGGAASLSNPKLLYLKAFLFLLCGSIAGGVLIDESPSA